MHDLANLFKGLSDPIRLTVVGLLLEHHELCVCQLIAALKLPQSTISRHLAYLKRTGWVTSRQEGLWQHYRIADTLRQQHPDLLKATAAEVERLPEMQKLRDVVTAERGKQTKPC